MRQYLNWKTYLAVIALLIVSASLYYTSQLAQKLAAEEKKKVEELAGALKTLIRSNNIQETAFASNIIAQNTTIPLIILDDKGRISDSRNIDTLHAVNPHKVVEEKLEEFKKTHKPIIADYGT